MLSGVTLRGPSAEQCGRQPRCILVHKQGWGVGSRGLQILHGIPLIDAALLGADAALIVGGPDERHPTREVVVPPCHFTGLVKHLEGRPGGGERSSGPGTWVLQLAKGTLSWQWDGHSEGTPCPHGSQVQLLAPRGCVN